MNSIKNWSIMLVSIALLFGAYFYGKHRSEPKIKWYSDMTSQLQGRKIYLIDTPVMCPNHPVTLATGQITMVPGKEIGKIQLDVNLQTGQLRVVTNTVPAWFDCGK